MMLKLNASIYTSVRVIFRLYALYQGNIFLKNNFLSNAVTSRKIDLLSVVLIAKN